MRPPLLSEYELRQLHGWIGAHPEGVTQRALERQARALLGRGRLSSDQILARMERFGLLTSEDERGRVFVWRRVW